jgi:HSP20 family molecular chaperone IbpA
MQFVVLLQRTLTLPLGVDLDKITSSYEHGELHITLQKLPTKQIDEARSSKIKRIPVVKKA